MGKPAEPVATPPTPKVEEVVATAAPETPPAATKSEEPPASDQVAGDDIHRIKRTKLSGPTIMGKIELPVDPPKRKPVASSTGSVGDKDKKKRKRTDRKSVV